jgi:hypothetical protein
MANCEQCGYTLECHAGCGIFCRNDCTDCILWCEPHDHVMVMRREEQGDGARTRVSTTEGLDRAAGAPRYSEDEEFRVCFNQLSRYFPRVQRQQASWVDCLNGVPKRSPTKELGGLRQHGFPAKRTRLNSAGWVCNDQPW